jgi:hypothetical protein
MTTTRSSMPFRRRSHVHIGTSESSPHGHAETVGERQRQTGRQSFGGQLGVGVIDCHRQHLRCSDVCRRNSALHALRWTTSNTSARCGAEITASSKTGWTVGAVLIAQLGLDARCVEQDHTKRAETVGRERRFSWRPGSGRPRCAPFDKMSSAVSAGYCGS